jgi:hypothetical protein
MEPRDWLHQALEELLALAPVAENEPDDAWRALVLVGRLLGSPSGPIPPAELLRRLPALLARAGLPEPEPLLERLSADLRTEDDPAGPLLDTLLDIDDALGVLSISGDAETARALTRRATALVSRSAARVHPLRDFAGFRAATVRPDSNTAVLWNAVSHASDPLPAETPPAQPQEPRAPKAPLQGGAPPRPHRLVVLGFPREAFHALAWTGLTPLAFASQDGGTRAWLYEEEGRLRLELRGTSATPTRARLQLVRRDEATDKATLELTLEVSGNTAYADLGPTVGEENLLHMLLARAGLSPEEADVHLVVMDD